MHETACTCVTLEPGVLRWRGPDRREPRQGEIDALDVDGRRSIDRYIDLHGVWAFTPQDAWVAGERLSYVNGNAIRSGALAHWDGTAWTVEDKAEWPRFRAIWGSTPNDVWAVGPEGLVHRDANGWTPLNLTGLHGNHIWGASQTDAWIVGPGGRTLHLEPEQP
jgi:hypothetical protein